jgi:hypothetical protein
MKKLAFIILPSLLLTVIGVSGQPLEVQSVCNLAVPEKVRVFNWSSWRTTYIQDQNLFFEPFRWDASQSIWRGYEAEQPFEQPRDAYKHWTVTLIQPDGNEQWIHILDSRRTPDTDYVYVFDIVDPTRDPGGQHYGYHPCSAFAINAAVVDDWLHRVYHPA